MFFYVMTIQAVINGMLKMGTYATNISWPDWDGSEYQAFMNRLDDSCSQLGSDPNATYVVHWSFSKIE